MTYKRTWMWPCSCDHGGPCSCDHQRDSLVPCTANCNVSAAKFSSAGYGLRRHKEYTVSTTTGRLLAQLLCLHGPIRQDWLEYVIFLTRICFRMPPRQNPLYNLWHVWNPYPQFTRYPKDERISLKWKCHWTGLPPLYMRSSWLIDQDMTRWMAVTLLRSLIFPINISTHWHFDLHKEPNRWSYVLVQKYLYH